MKLATFTRHDSSQALGVLIGDSVLDLSAADPANPAFASMLALIAAGPGALAAARELADRAAKPDPGREIARHLVPAAQAPLLAPIPRPAKNVFCVGLNFRSHVEQNA